MNQPRHYPEKPLIDCILPDVEWNTARDPDALLCYIDMQAIDVLAKLIKPCKAIRRRQVPPGDLRIVRTGDVLMFPHHEGDVPVALSVPAHADGCSISAQFRVLRANPGLMTPRFLFHMAPIYCMHNAILFGKGKARQRIIERQALSGVIALPTLAEQQHICRAIDLIGDAALDHLQEWLKHSAMMCQMQMAIYDGKMQVWAQLEQADGGAGNGVGRGGRGL